MLTTKPARALLLLLASFAAACLPASWGCSSSTNHTDDADAGGEMNDAVTWCAAYKIINCSCQQCHQSPPLNGAPIPLMTYADTQAPFPMPTSDERAWQVMQDEVRIRFMPYTGDPTVMPPVKPLTDDQQNTLLTWLEQGAHDEGGPNCPQSCDWPKASP